jgi:hypothetical protein
LGESERQSSLGKSKTDQIVVKSVTINGKDIDCVRLSGNPSDVDIKIRGVSKGSYRISLEAKLTTYDGFIVAAFCPGHFTETVNVARPGMFELDARICLAAMTKGRYWLNLYLTNPSREGYWDFAPGVILEVQGAFPSSGVGEISRQTGHGVFLLPGKEQLEHVDSDEDLSSCA